MDASVTFGLLSKFEKEFSNIPQGNLLLNASTSNKFSTLSLSYERLREINTYSFTTVLDDWKCTDQRHSGRCWIFGGLTIIRPVAIKKFGIKNFELSPNYLYFYDKLEKANYFLEDMINHLNNPIDPQSLSFIYEDLMSDGGQFSFFVNLIEKYGLVPLSFMPETPNSDKTKVLKLHLREFLFQGAKELKQLQSKNINELREIKGKVLQQVYTALCYHLGTPPKMIYWPPTRDFILSNILVMWWDLKLSF
eukprot:TRINITY_DN8635_c0_g1_i1.p1 TRINITY_DN8635_c0_g1~~TRINITY_DN8635_c0_g1_i1.p1  ORF type:complete len:250 (+),score=31.40 TRINITY_DN8635_c0_g1_i1:43-792(+)